jgi:uncharacterized protein (DUF433 family)
MAPNGVPTLRDPDGHQVPFGIRRDEQGVLRIGRTRVTLETLLDAYHAGLTVEQILDDYPSLTTPDVLAALAVYEADRAAFADYLAVRVSEAEVLRGRSESRNDLARLRRVARRAG